MTMNVCIAGTALSLGVALFASVSLASVGGPGAGLDEKPAAPIAAQANPNSDPGVGGVAAPESPSRAVQCPVSCTSGNFIPENEPCGVNTINCGCDCSDQNFLQLRCPEGYCGDVWAINGQYDTDWYNVHVNDPGGNGIEYVCFDVNADFPVVVQLWSGNCGSLTLVVQGQASDCNPLHLCACVPAPAFYKLKIYAGTIAGGPILNGMPCPPINKYTLRYLCNDVCTNVGACCYQIPGIPGYQCGMMTQQECSQLLNSFWWGPNSSCNPNPCNPPTGACCFVDATGVPACTVTTQQDCQAIYNGTYMGNGVPCIPDPCQLHGACCYLDPTGVPLCAQTTQQECFAVYNGTYMGNGVPCTPNPCIPRGACCYIDPVVPGFQCIITTAQDCQAIYNGNYLGNGSICTPDPCNVTGACCYRQPGQIFSQCVVTTQADCLTNYPNSIYMGNGTNCTNVQCNPPPDTGACCYQVPGTTIFQCVITTQSDCLNNYFNSTWLGANTSCTSVPPPCNPPLTGACCYRLPPPQTGYGCAIMTLVDCQAIGGLYQGNGTSCALVVCDPPPSIGACCFQDLPNPTWFCVVVTQANCLQNYPNSTWMGANTTCNPNPCHDTLGACCWINPAVPGVQCTITSQIDCQQNLNGQWQGPNTTCNPNPCDPLGACCYVNAIGVQCTVTTQLLCSGLPAGVWMGPNTSCSPNPCFPTGACCFQDGPQAQVICVVVTQAQCALYPNGVWQGANTTCNPNPCPPALGACCYQIIGTTIYTCTVTSQVDCTQGLHGQYLGNGVPCSAAKCGPCNPPPPNMMAWWAMDDLTGPLAREAVAGKHGQFQPNSATGPVSGPGRRQTALWFDGVNDWLLVPNNAQLTMGPTDFTVDAWINWNYYNGSINPEIVTASGYRFRLVTGANAPAGLLLWLTGGVGDKCLKFGVVPPNQWVHVAATYQQPSPATANNGICKLYLNGALIHTETQGPLNSWSNNGLTRIGNSLSGSAGNYFKGGIDEVEIFNRALTAAEIDDIYVLGKCKQRCHVEWDRPFCLGQNQITVPITLCNDSPVAHPYNITFQTVPVSTGCSINGPTVFTPLFSNPVTIPANTCVTVQVTINRPTGMNAVYQVGCYDITMANLDNGSFTTCHGSVQDRRDLCAVIGPCCIGTGVVVVGVPTQATFVLTNTGGVPITNGRFMIQSFDSHTMELSSRVSLNGLPPGTRYIGNLVLAPGATTPVAVSVQYLSHHPLGFDDLVVSTDTDNDGVFEPLISQGIESVPRPDCPADVAPAGGDHNVNVNDLLVVINGWGPCPPPPQNCPGDINGDGTVNVNDLLLVINAWGPCP